MNFFVFNHQGKADAYIRALTTRGWTQTKDPGEAKFILSDCDVNGRARTLDSYHRRSVKVFLYPHAGRPNIFWDFPDTPFRPCVDAHFVSAQGHAEIMRAYGVPYDLRVTGWHLCQIRAFHPREHARRILFAPIHPNSNGFLCELDKELNRQTFRKLLTLLDGQTTLLVRHIRGLEKNGLWRAGGVDYIEGNLDLSYEEIDRADLVVTHQTFAYLAVARGVPTLMMGEWYPPRWGGSENALMTVQSWDMYKHLLMYPLDILAAEDLSQLIQCAIHSDSEIADWRARLIGQPFDPDRFADLVESLL